MHIPIRCRGPSGFVSRVLVLVSERVVCQAWPGGLLLRCGPCRCLQPLWGPHPQRRLPRPCQACRQVKSTRNKSLGKETHSSGRHRCGHRVCASDGLAAEGRPDSGGGAAGAGAVERSGGQAAEAACLSTCHLPRCPPRGPCPASWTSSPSHLPLQAAPPPSRPTRMALLLLSVPSATHPAPPPPHPGRDLGSTPLALFWDCRPPVVWSPQGVCWGQDRPLPQSTAPAWPACCPHSNPHHLLPAVPPTLAPVTLPQAYTRLPGHWLLGQETPAHQVPYFSLLGPHAGCPIWAQTPWPVPFCPYALCPPAVLGPEASSAPTHTQALTMCRGRRSASTGQPKDEQLVGPSPRPALLPWTSIWTEPPGAPAAHCWGGGLPGLSALSRTWK